MKLTIHASVKQNHDNSQLGYIVIHHAKIQGMPPSLAQKFFQLQTAIAEVYNIDEIANIRRLGGMRSLYNKEKFDATRYDLASEQLARKALGNTDAYYVNSAVGAIKYCSIHFLLPIGLYDLDQIQGDVVYGFPVDDSYVNMDGEVVLVDDQPFLADQQGLFGNATVDTRRTAVKLSSNNLLVVVYADQTIDTAEFTKILEFTGDMITRYNGGTIVEQDII